MKLKRILAFILAVALVVTALPGEMLARAEETTANVEKSITLNIGEENPKIHISGDGYQNLDVEGGERRISLRVSHIQYDFKTAGRLNPCIDNLEEAISTIGIDRYPYAVTKLNVKKAGNYTIKVKVNMNGTSVVDTMAIVVDGVVHTIKLNGTGKQTVGKTLPLSKGEHSILYMSPMPEDASKLEGATSANVGNYYPWANFWSFTFEDPDTESNIDINDSLEILDASSLDGTAVKNIFKEFTRIEAEDSKYAVNNKFTPDANGAANASGGKFVAGAGYNLGGQTFEEIGQNGIDKSKMAYSEYKVDAPVDGEYYIRIGAYIGTGSNSATTSVGKDLPYIAVVANNNAPVKAQFDGENWNEFKSIIVPVNLKKGINVIRCTGILQGQYTVADANQKPSAWVNLDYIELQKGLTARPVEVSAGTDYDNYLYLNRYNYQGSGGSNFSDLRWDSPSLYEDLFGIYTRDNGKNYYRWPYVAFTVNAAETGVYQITANIGADSKANPIGMIVDGATHVVNLTATSGDLTKSVYLTKGTHVIIFTSPMLKDMVNKPALPTDTSNIPTGAYVWFDFNSFKLSEGLAFGEKPTNENILNAMSNYTRVEAEDVVYAVAKGNYNADISKNYVRRINDPYTVKVKGTSGAVIDGSVSNDEKNVNNGDSYIEYKVNATEAGKYILRVGAYVESNGSNAVSGTVKVNNSNTLLPVEFTVTNKNGDTYHGYDVANIPVELTAGVNTIRCYGVTGENVDAWIGYDFIDIPKGLEKVALRVTMQANDTKIHRSNVNKPNDDGVKAYTESAGLAGNVYNMIYDANNRNAKVCIYNLRKLMTEPIGTSSDKGIGRYPYVVTKINVKDAGYYDIGTEINMRKDGKVDTMLIMVDGAVHIVNAKLGSEAHQEVWKKNLYLAAGEHTILYMSAMPKYESDCPDTADVYYYPWTNFWGFMVQKTNGDAIDNSVEYLNASTLSGTDVGNIFEGLQQYTRIEAENLKYANWNIYNKVDNDGKTVGGVSSYSKSEQSFDDLTNDGLNKEKTPYVEYVVDAPTAGTYDITICAYIGTSGNTSSDPYKAKPYIAVLVNDKAPVKAQFGKWKAFDSVTVSVELDAGINTIRCTAPTKGQPDNITTKYSSTWVNHDYIEVPNELTVVQTGVTASDDDWNNYLYLNRYKDSGAAFGGPNYDDMRYDFPSLYEEMLGIYNDIDPERAGYWPYIALTVNAEEAGEYQISAKIGMDTNTYNNDASAKTVGMIVNGAMYIVEVPGASSTLSKKVYLSEGNNVIIFTSPIFRDMESRPKDRANSTQYPYMNFEAFKLSAGLSFVAKPTAADVKTTMTSYVRIEAEDVLYASTNGNYNTAISKDYTRRYGTTIAKDSVKIQGIEGAAIDGKVTAEELKVNTSQSYVQYAINAPAAGTYVIRVGAYLEGSGSKPYGTILVNGKAYKAEFTGNWNGYDAVNLAVEMQAGENIIQCIGITADQACKDTAWIGYDFIEVPSEFTYHKEGQYTNTSVEKGLSFERRTTYETEGTISEEPYTISTWVYLPAGYMPVGGVLFGNYLDGETPCTNFEIDGNGVPSFYHINDKGQKVSLKFNMVDVCADEWTNLTFTISGNDVSCYKNGLLVATLTSEADINMEAVKNQYLLGGDLRPTTEEGSPNARYFKGRILEVALYNKALSKEEVLKVYKAEASAPTPYTRYELENAEKDKDVPDTIGDNHLEAKLPYFDKTPVTDYAYSFAVLPDIQIVTENDVTKGESNLEKMFDWIINNQESKKIEYVFGLGDITDNNNAAEWTLAQEQHARLTAAGIPYSAIRGNHDLPTYGKSSSAANYNTDDYTAYMGTDDYRAQFATGGFYSGDNISNSWRTFEVGEVKYLMLTLDFGPDDDVLKWAEKIIKQHSEYQVIITTHAYLYRDGTTLDANENCPPIGNGGYNNGDDIWEKLVSKYENIVLVMCGHDPSDNIVVSRDKGDNGNMVTSMLIDAQGVDSDMGSTGMLAMLYFSEDGKTVQVEYLSTVKAAKNEPAYFKAVNQFTLNLFNEEVSASDKDWKDYLKLNMYLDNGTSFGVGNGDDGKTNYGHIRYDYPSLYEDMLGIYSDSKADRTNWWPYIAFTVNAEADGEYEISAEITTNKNAKTIGMIVDGAMHVVDVTTKKGDVTGTVYLTKGEHVVIFTSPMPRDMEMKPSTTGSNVEYPYMDFKAFKLGDGLSFGTKPTDTDIQNAMSGFTRIESDDISFVTSNGNYNANISKKYADRYGNGVVKVKGIKGAKIDGKASDSEKKVNSTQTYKEIQNGLDANKTSYVEYKVLADKAGSYTIRVGAYLEGKGTIPYGTILVNGKAYKAQFTGNWNGYDAVNLQVELKAGENIIQCIGVTADQKDTNGWIGYDFIDIPGGVGTELMEVSASDKDWKTYLKLNMYLDNGNTFGVGNGEDGQTNYGHIRYDYPSLYEDMLGIYSDVKPDRANWWPYIAFTVNAETAGEYQIVTKFTASTDAKTIGMIVDGAVHIVNLSEDNELLNTVYLSKGEHVIIFTSPIPRDMVSAPSTMGTNQDYPWMDYSSFKLGIGLSFGKAPTDKDIQRAMTSYTRVEAEDIVYATYHGNYDTDVTKNYPARYNNAMTTIMGAKGAAIDGKVTAEELKANTSQSYVQYSINAKETGTYMIRVGAYLEGSGSLPYGTILVNGKAYKAEFAGNWNGYDAVNLLVELQKGANIIQCFGVTADQTDANGWIGYDYLDIQSGLSANGTGATQIHAGDEKYVTFNNYKDQGDVLGGGSYNDMRWDRLSVDILNYAYLYRMPYAAIQVKAAADGTYDVYFKSQYDTTATSKQIGVLVDGVTTYTMTLSEFRSHVSIPLTAGTHTLVFTTPMPADFETAAKTAKFDKKAYPWMDMEMIILGKGLTVEKAPDKKQLEEPFEAIEVEEYAMPNLTQITKNGAGSAQYLKAQTVAEIVKNGIDPTVTPYVEYYIDASAAGEYTIYVALTSGMAAAMTAEKQLCSIVIENGDTRQVQKFYTHKDTSSVARIIPVTLTLQKGINEVRISHFTGDSIQGKGYVWNDFDYIEMSPETAKKLTFLPTSVLEAEEATYVSYLEQSEEGMSGEAYLGNASYGYIDENKITFEALDVENLDDVPRVTYTFEAEKAGTYTLSVKFRTGLINYTPEELEKIGFAVIVNGKDKQLVEYEMGSLVAPTTRTITVELVEGENEITFTSTLADFMNAVSPRIESDYRLVYVDHDALYLSYGLSTGKEAEKFSVEDSSVARSQLELLGLADDADDVSGFTAEQMTGVIIGAAALVMLAILIIIVMKKKKQEEEGK
ncbi:MAG: metallophosphoesterase [Tyzzerella sp.]|nr:metallophosphoesterase [Tyzzerella sp.]